MTTTTQRPACLLCVADLRIEHAHWQARTYRALMGTGPELTADEKARAAEVGEAFEDWREAIRDSYRYPFNRC